MNISSRSCLKKLSVNGLAYGITLLATIGSDLI